MMRIMLVHLEESVAEVVRATLGCAELVDCRDSLDSIMEQPMEPGPALILCGLPSGDRTLIEFGQGLGITYPHAPIFHVTSRAEGFDRPVLLKNAFRDGFLLPFERSELEHLLVEVAAKHCDPARAYRPVRMVDIDPDQILDFDTYIFLPLNSKFVRLTKAGRCLGAEYAERFRKRDLSSLYVRVAELPKFYEFTAKQLHRLGKNGTLSETEKRERAAEAVRSIVCGIFADQKTGGFEEGQLVIDDCKEVIRSYLRTEKDAQTSFDRTLSSLMDEKSGVYAHSTNVATFAALFSMGLGIGDPESLALAALLHDIGISELPPSIQGKDVQDMTSAEFEVYRTHPERSIKLLQKKRVTLDDVVFKIILQHHERPNGNGFPMGLAGKEILPEAQVLAIADAFTDLIEVRPGLPRVHPRQAIKALVQNNTDPLRCFVEPALLDRLSKLVAA